MEYCVNLLLKKKTTKKERKKTPDNCENNNIRKLYKVFWGCGIKIEGTFYKI